MTVLEVTAILTIALAALGMALGVAWRASNALVIVKLELVAIRLQLTDLMSRPPQWCHDQQGMCDRRFERREDSHVQPSTGGR